MAQIRTITANRCFDFFAGFGMCADNAGQSEQLQRPFQIEIVEILGYARALGFLALAQLDVGAETAGLAFDRQARFRVFAENRVLPAVVAFAARFGKLAGELAVGVIGAGNKGAEPSAAQGKSAAIAAFRFAQRAMAGVLAVGPFGEEIVGQEFVQNLGNFRGLLLHDLFGLGLEVLPEVLEQRLPLFFTGGDLVEFVFHSRSEFIGNVTLEEAFEKCRQKPARFLCKETVFLHPHIFTIADRLDCTGVGRGAADAELFQLFHQARFRKTRRRLGEMLAGFDLLLGRCVALAHVGEQAVLIIVGAIVAAFLVNSEKSGEFNDLAGRAKFMPAGAVAHGDRGALKLRGGHLAGHRTLEDEVVKLALIA